MQVSGGRLARLAGAAVFAVAALAVIVPAMASRLDEQGNDRVASIFSDVTLQWLDGVSERTVMAKQPVSRATLDAARDAAKRMPLAPQPYFIAGTAKALAGDAAGARALVDLSVHRDPRFLPARYWRIQDAAQRSDPAAATAAVLRAIDLDVPNRDANIGLLVKLTPIAQSWPLIRAAMPGARDWRDRYYDQLVGAKLEPSLVFNAIDVAHAASGAPPVEHEQAGLLASLVEKGDFDRAYTAWLGWLPADALGKLAYVYDGEFTGARGAPPFNWKVSTSGDASASVERGHGLRFDYLPGADAELASEMLMMTPGNYRLSSVAALDNLRNPDTEVPVGWRLLCLPSRAEVLTMRFQNSTDPKPVAADFTIGENCQAQLLELAGLAMEMPVQAGGYVRSVAIEKKAN